MTYEQPQLPYSREALEPAISATTIDYHYGKHEKAYIDNLNRLIKGTEYEDMSLEEVIAHSQRALQQCLTGMEPYLLLLHICPRWQP